MLASPVADEAEALARMTPPVWVEDKYDGIRAQLHKQGSRGPAVQPRPHDVSEQFPEVLAAAADLPWDGILDGELLAWRDGAALPFQQLQARLGRKRPSAQIQADVPVIYVAFDAAGAAAMARPRRSRCCACRSASAGRGSRRWASTAPRASGLAALTSAADEDGAAARSSMPPRRAATRA